MTRPIRTAALALVLALALPAWAATDNGAWNRDFERLDYYTNPPEKGDNTFFTVTNTTNGNTNVALLYPASSSMNGFSQKLYRIRADLGGSAPTGCTNSYLNNLTYFMPTNIAPPAAQAKYAGTYNSATTYPDPETTYSGGGGVSANFSSTSYYRFKNWPAGGSGGTAETASSACQALTGNNSSAQNSCLTCVTTKGYWINPAVANNDSSPAGGVFSGNWLNFHPPKWVLLRLAYKRLVNGPLLSVLREGVLGANNGFGASQLQKMLPQSCSGTGRPLNQKIGAVDGLTYTSAAHPLAEMLFNAAWFMGGQESPWWFDNNNQSLTAVAGNKSGPCNSCSGDFLVLFADGRGDTANPNCVPNLSGVLPAQCTAQAQCSTLGMGTEDDGNDFLNSPTGVLGTAAPGNINGLTDRQTPGGTCDMDFADDVARWMHNHDVSKNTTGSKLTVFVVGIGDPNNTYGEMTALQAIATAGGGQYVVADDYATLEANIELVLQTIIKRATSFSTSSVTTVQTRGITSAYLPRFRPVDGPQWWGNLLRFELYNEFAAGCSSVDYGKVDTLNPNGNSSCNDFYLLDKNQNFVGEDSNGNFVVLDNSQAWNNGWPIKTDSSGNEIPAVPVWDAAALLSSRENQIIAGTSTDERTLYTVTPNGTGYGPTLTNFSVTNAATLDPYLALGGVNGPTCQVVASLSRTTFASETDCATMLIKFLYGRDVFTQNPYNQAYPQPSPLQSRPNILGDIFHSSPVVVSPPVPTYLCDLGIANQCSNSLYSSRLTPNGSTAYNSYTQNNQYRTQVVLIGANDGMLHAFNAANDKVDAQGHHSWDLGTGKELWAFIPPDLMPKLQRYAVGERHEMLVDGSPLVRDIWVDGSGATTTPDGKKQADEFHTIAVVGEREGGRKYFALDVTDPTNPKYLWTWPAPGTTEDVFAGESWNDFSPGTPPIGPVAVDDPNGPLTIGGVKASEKYVVAVGGGWDPEMLRGKSIYAIDAWTGKTIYRFSRMDSTGGSDPRQALMPVVAPISMLDTDADGLFDAMVVGDAGGQVWTIGMSVPGKDTDADGLIDNWYGGRAFVEFKGSALWHRSPFFQPASAAALTTGDIRVFLGGGQRDQIKDGAGGTCGLANVMACIRKDCTVDMQSKYYRVGPTPQGGSGGHYVLSEWKYQSGGTSLATNNISRDGLGNTASDLASDAVDAEIDTSISCSSTNNQWANSAYCDWGASIAGTDCPTSTGRPLGAKIDYTPTFTEENSRFYSIKLFDKANRARFTTLAGAQTYDQNALTDTDLVNAATATASLSSNGWYLAHTNSADEKTASGSLLLGGCIVWNTLVPNTSQTVACGGSIPPDSAYMYQADAVTGAISCGEANSPTFTQTSRFQRHDTYVTPQEPAPIISVNSATGQVNYGGLTIEPGRLPLSITVGTNDILGTIHWLEVPRRLHDCRHAGVNCSQ